MSTALGRLSGLMSKQEARKAEARAREEARAAKAEAAFTDLAERLAGGEDVAESAIEQVCNDAGRTLGDLFNIAQRRSQEIPDEAEMARLADMAEKARAKIKYGEAAIAEINSGLEFSRRTVEMLDAAKAYGLNSDVRAFLQEASTRSEP